MVELCRGSPIAGLPDQNEPTLTPVSSADQPDFTEKVFVGSLERPRTAGKTPLRSDAAATRACRTASNANSCVTNAADTSSLT